MGLFSRAQIAQVNAIAEKSKASLEQSAPKTARSTKGLNAELKAMSDAVIEYFKDSKAILITSKEQLHDYVTNLIDSGYGSLDIETTGLDRIRDTIVGASLYYPGGVECYIPSKHLVPIFDAPYKDQLTYEEIGEELQRIADSSVKLIFANADFDLSMIYKDLKVDLIKNCYYDVILAWRCLKENERNNRLKELYNKYVLKGEGDPKTFSDFFPPKLFPYCKPEVAKLYAANDAKITYELFTWQLPYVMKDNPKCKKNHLEAISDLIWGVEFPLMGVCQKMHRDGIYIEPSMAEMLNRKYLPIADAELKKLQGMVQEILDNPKYTTRVKRPFLRATDFNPESTPHVAWLCYDLMKLDSGKGGRSTGKEILGTFNAPVAKQILKCRSLGVLISTFVKKLPNAVGPDGKIHCTFKQIGADTGRFSSADPNMQNIPSKAGDIRRMFRAMPGHVLMSSDYSQQEPKLTAYVSQDEKMVQAFKDNKDIYSIIASIAFGVPYEDCLEFKPTGKFDEDGNPIKVYNASGKARRGEAKTIVLGITYGRSVVTIADQLYAHEPWSDEEKIKKAQHVFDSVLNAFPSLRKLMINAQNCAKTNGYVETILGRRRHIPDMQLPEFEFKPMKGYVNPDIDPLDVSTLDNQESIPQRVVDRLYKELTSYKYFGQVAKRIRELAENDHIKVINNRFKIQEASRKCVNSIIQGSAAEQTKLAMLLIDNDPEWNALGGHVILPVHDELIAEVPIENWEACANRLSKLMCDAASFLPFASKCDVTVSYRWNGMEYPCKYPKPNSLDNLTEDEVMWVQYHLFECGYELPVFKTPDGDKPEGDAALGVNGVVTDQYNSYIRDYCNRYNITEDEFIYHIHTKVHTGSAPVKQLGDYKQISSKS